MNLGCVEEEGEMVLIVHPILLTRFLLRIRHSGSFKASLAGFNGFFEAHTWVFLVNLDCFEESFTGGE